MECFQSDNNARPLPYKNTWLMFLKIVEKDCRIPQLNKDDMEHNKQRKLN